jgi:hypothetical protein
VCKRNTKERIYEIAVFTRVTDSFTFDMEGADFKNKRPIGDLEVSIAVWI